MAMQDIKEFQLLDFETGNKNKKKPLMIECVPSRWISFNPSIGKCQCKFMPPPYSKEDTELVDTLVKQQGHPPESWPTYTVNLRGHATTYDDAMKRLETLTVQPYAYTEDGVLPAEKATNVTKAYQRLKIIGDQALANKLMQVPILVPHTGQHSSTSEDLHYETSDVSIDENQNNKDEVKKKKDHKHVTDTESTDENSNILKRSKNKPKHKPKNTGSSKTSTSTRDCAQVHHETSDVSIDENQNNKDEVKKTKDYKHVTDTESTDENSNILERSKNKPKHKPKNTGSSKTSTFTRDCVQDGKDSQLLSQTSTGNRGDKVKLLSSRRQGDVSEKPRKSHTSQSFAHSSKEPSPPSQSRAPKKKDDPKDQTEALKALSFDIQALATAINELKGIIGRSALAQNAFGTNVQSFATEFNVVLPITTMEDFHTFDDRLKMDKKLRKEFAVTLHFIVDSHTTLARNITAMLKKHISRDLALKFNAVKSAKDKEVFKETKLCSLLRDVLLLKYKEGAQGTVPITEKFFYRELGTCLSNAVDWDGHRKERRNKKTDEISDAESTNHN